MLKLIQKSFNVKIFTTISDDETLQWIAENKKDDASVAAPAKDEPKEQAVPEQPKEEEKKETTEQNQPEQKEDTRSL